MAHAMIKSILVSEVVRMIAEKFQLPEEEAMDQFYTRKIGKNGGNSVLFFVL